MLPVKRNGLFLEAPIKIVTRPYCASISKLGLGIEIRYNFNPNDSSRLRKDVEMAQFLKSMGYTPIYLIFSSISPRDDAIARLKRAGWTFVVGPNAIDYTHNLFGFDLVNAFKHPEVKEFIERRIKSIMDLLYRSAAFQDVNNKYD